ncbi:MAG: hypothetical protein MUE51_03140 [Thermoleophilia bacterium]|jgi:hypothetical protein|nr:hypothetical protein [Thermoleophilia bacterium]
MADVPRFPAGRLLAVAPADLLRAQPGGEPAQVWRDVRELLDRAHATLDPHHLAAALAAIRQMIAPLLAGRPPAWRRRPPAVPAGATGAVRAVGVALCLGARSAGPRAGVTLRSLGVRIDAYIDEVAARPGGARQGPG